MRNLIQCGAISLGWLRGEFLSLNKAIAVESGCCEQAAKSTVRAREIIFCTNTGRNKVPPALSNRTMAGWRIAYLVQRRPEWSFKVENFANGRESAKCYLLNAAAANFCPFRPIFIATGRIRRSIKVYLAAAERPFNITFYRLIVFTSIPSLSGAPPLPPGIRAGEKCIARSNFGPLHNKISEACMIARLSGPFYLLAPIDPPAIPCILPLSLSLT